MELFTARLPVMETDEPATAGLSCGFRDAMTSTVPFDQVATIAWPDSSSPVRPTVVSVLISFRKSAWKRYGLGAFPPANPRDSTTASWG